MIVDNDTRNGSIYLEMKSRMSVGIKQTVMDSHKEKSVYKDGENPFPTGTARFTRTEKKRIRHSPNGLYHSSEAGNYAVYMVLPTSPNSVSNAKYSASQRCNGIQSQPGR